MRLSRVFPFVFVFILAAAPLAARTYQARYAEAAELAAKNDPKAESLLRDLLVERPTDANVKFRLGLLLVVEAFARPADAARNATVVEARRLLQEAKLAGFEHPLLDGALAQSRDDGSLVEHGSYSSNDTANAWIKSAEAEFAAGKFDDALADYQAALKIEPENFSATLWLGDTYFAKGRLPEALDWYHRASVLQPDTETPWRYSGDALVRLGRKDEAMEAYLAAAIAEPYHPLTLRTLSQFAHERGLKAGFRAGPLPTGNIRLDHGGVTMELAQGADAADTVYATARAAWVGQHRDEAIHDGVYRQTLAEEASALRAVLAAFVPEEKSDSRATASTKYDAALRDLARIDHDGLLEAHIFFTRANPDLAKDYPAYRAAHRVQLRTYLRHYFLGES
ncbi:MAG TPA: tetratricopeptide repeat protein [Candidatus Didemnitutus sp.]|nr:tetratricopeptide repeat protein [Candidatus Didemnitutus sp.]